MEKTKNTSPQPAIPKTENVLGKRSFCEKCGTEVICTKRGPGQLWCCGAPMKLKEAKPLPSSD